MVHSYEFLGKYIVLDVESGTVMSVDKLVYDIISVFDNNKETIVELLSNEYPIEQIQSALLEIDELISQGQLFSNYDYSMLSGEPASDVIKALCLHIAHDCNLRCKYCFASTGDFHGDREMMSSEIGKKALDLLIERSGNRVNLDVDFFGGEPLMNFEVVKEIVAYGRELENAYDKIFKFTLTTNGLALNDDVKEFLNKEMSNVVLSIDGRKEIHDNMRSTVNGKPSFDIIMPKVKAFVEAREQSNYYVRGTFTRENLDFSKDILALADYGFEQISLEPVVTDENEPYSIKKEHISQINNEYEKLAIEYLDRRKNGKWFNFFHFMIDLTGGPCLIKRLTGCGAGNEYIAITPKGDIYPCHQFVGIDEFKMGNVNDFIINNSIRMSFRNNNVLKKKKCVECWAKYYCSGGCAANAFKYSDDINTPYEIACQMEKKRIECAIGINIIESGEVV